MANINEILARAAALRDETALNSISPERAGGIMYDTLIALNELWLQQGAALVISKIYASVAAMEADTAPVSDLTGKPLRPGQIVVIASSDSDNGSVYRYNGTESPSWSLVGSIGNLDPVDSLDSDSTTLPLAAHQGKVLDSKISQLGQDVIRATAFDSVQNIDLSGATTGTFWRNGGQQEANSSWKSISLDCRPYTGKYIRIRAGYNNPSLGLNTLVAFCFVKKTNDSYTALVDYVVGFENDYAAIVKLPTDAKGLDLSWNFNDSGKVLPLCGITLVDSIKYADNNITLPNTDNTINETLMDKSLEVNQQLTAVNTYIDRALYSDGVMRYASGYSVGQYDVTSIKRVIIDGYQGDGGYLLAQVTDSSDKTICMWAIGARGAMTNYQLLLPSGSKYLFVTHYGSSSVSSLKDSYRGTNILENIKSINSSVLAIEATELGKYWQSGDTISSNENWAYTTIDLSQFRGKALRVRGGYLNSTDYSTWLLYSFIKRTNNQFIALSEVSPKLQLDGCWIVRIPQDAAELQLSWAYKDAGGKVMPLVQYEPSDNWVLLDDSHLQNIDANPLSTVIRTPSYTGIINEWGFIGDSLSSGAMECYEGSQVKYIDMYEYSWCQRMCQLNNVIGYNFTQGGQTAKGWITGATERTWDADGAHNGASVNLKKGYCIYLGTNDSYVYTTDAQIGTTADINTSDYLLNEDTFVGNYAGIIQRIKSVQPKAKIFCITCLRNLTKFNTQIRNIVTFFQSVYPGDIYLVDLMRYVPISLAYTNNGYNLNGHNSALGYEYVAYCMNTYIDWIIRNNKLAFKGVSLIGTDYTEEPLTD